MDFSMLRGKIVEKYGTCSEFAKVLGVTKGTLSMKLNGKLDWDTSDVIKVSRLLGISAEDIGRYFFTEKVKDAELANR